MNTTHHEDTKAAKTASSSGYVPKSDFTFWGPSW